VARTAGFPLRHITHGKDAGSSLEREYFSMAIRAFIYLKMKFVTESCHAGRGFESNSARFHCSVAFVTVTVRSKSDLAVVAFAARQAFCHVSHGRETGKRSVLEYFGVALLAGIDLGMKRVVEEYCSGIISGKCDIMRFHTVVAMITISRHRKNFCAGVANTASLPFFHLGHGDAFPFDAEHLAVVATLAGTAGLGNMGGMGE